MKSSRLLEMKRNVPLPYVVSVPPDSTETGLRPILCFLHGYHEAAPLSIDEAVTRHGPLCPGNPTRVRETFIVIAPQLPALGGDVWHAKAADVREIVETLQQQYAGDRARTYLTGFSYGGNGVFDLAPVHDYPGPLSGRSTQPSPPLRPLECRFGYVSARLLEANGTSFCEPFPVFANTDRDQLAIDADLFARTRDLTTSGQPRLRTKKTEFMIGSSANAGRTELFAI